MAKPRRKLSAVYNDFITEIGRLERYNQENQYQFSSSSSSSGTMKLSIWQLHMLTETVFFNCYRAYENFLRDTFLLYCMEKRPKIGHKVTSYLRPKGFFHAELLIQSSMPFLDWSSPYKVISRADLYLENGYPIKDPITTNLDLLIYYKRLRNHVAHNSKESLEEYKKTLIKHLGTIPLSLPSPGEFLLIKEKGKPHLYKLITFFTLLKKVSAAIT